MTMLKLIAVIVFAALVLASPVLAQPASSQPLSTEQRAEQLMNEGIALAEKKELRGARDKFAQAFGLKKAYDIAANLGFAEAELGEWEAAATHLDYARGVFPLSAPETFRATIEKYLVDAKSKVGVLRIDTEPGATLWVGARSVGTTPLDGPVYLSPGTHAIRCTKAGFEGGATTVEIAAGETVATTVRLVPTNGRDTPPPPAEERPIWPGLVLAGLGASGLGLGIAGFVVSVGAQSDADDAQLGLTDGECRDDPGPCAGINSSLDDANTFRGIGIAGLSVGGSAALGAILYFAIPGSEEAPRTTAIRVTPLLGAAQGVIVQGRF